MTEQDPEGRPASRTESVLTEWFLARERGEEPDLGELCEGDAALESNVRRLLGAHPRILHHLMDEGGGPPRSASHPIEDELVGTTLGGFRVLRLLGRGGMGAVYLAREDALRREVALKVIDSGRLSDPHTRVRFRREATLAAALEHPGIVPVFAVGESDGRDYLAMKWLEGPALDRLEQPLRAHEVARIGRALAEALEEAHCCGIVHRDVKPSNVLLDAGEPVLVDFGLARALGDTSLTSDHQVTGTLPYLAPELLQGRAMPLDPRADVYALGATLYELLQGQPPYPIEETERLVTRILFGEPVPLKVMRSERDLATIVQAALEKDPRHRIPTAGEFARELGRYLAGEAIALSPVGPLRRFARRARRRPKAAAVALVALILIAASSAGLVSAKWRQERALSRGLRTTRTELDQGRYARASESLFGLLHLRPDDERVLALRAEAEAGLALERLLDEIIAPPSAIATEQLRGLVEEARRTSLPQRFGPHAQAAMVLAMWHLDETEAAWTELEALRDAGGGGRLVGALSALLERAPFDSAAANAPALDPNEHVLIATALRLAGHGYDAQQSELDHALEIDPGHRLARWALAVALADAGRSQDSLYVLGDLLREGNPSRALRRNVARAYLRMGKVDAARRELRKIPVEDWSPIEAALQLELLLVAGEWEAYGSQLDEYLRDLDEGRWPEGWEILRAEAAFLATTQDRLDDALAILDEVRTNASDHVNHDLAAATAYRMKVDRATLALPADPEARRERIEPLIEEGELLLDSLRFRRALGVVSWKLAMANLCLGRAAQGFSLFEQCVPLIPDQPWARLEYARELLNFASVLHRTEPESQRPRFLEHQAWELSASLLSELRPGHGLLAEGERALIRDIAIEASLRAYDWQSAERLLAESPGSVRDPQLHERVERDLGSLRRKLEQALAD